MYSWIATSGLPSSQRQTHFYRSGQLRITMCFMLADLCYNVNI